MLESSLLGVLKIHTYTYMVFDYGYFKITQNSTQIMDLFIDKSIYL